MKDYEFMISQFVDNELSANEQRELFLFLSESEDGRKILSDYMEVKKETKLFYAGINPELNEPKIAAINISQSDNKEKKYKTRFYFAATASILFAFLFMSNFIKENSFESQYQNLQTENIILQENYSNALDKQMELNNQLHEKTEKPKVEKVEINKSAKRVFNRQATKKKKVQKKPSYKKRKNYLASIPAFTITKNDFLGQQIIGN
ncbi:MAG: hypothetical protein GY932_00405 [Arcobacter sp.]|nr:hypothetical protein [Arcobacter sp.]